MAVAAPHKKKKTPSSKSTHAPSSSAAGALSKLLPSCVLVCACAYLGLYLLLALLRIGYPFELEFLEGASIDYVARLLSPGKFYVPPSLEWIPCNYTPLYFASAALLAKLFGLGFFPLRLLSLLSSLGCFGMIALFVRHETRSWKAGVIGAGLYAASFAHTGGYFDISRPDSFFLLLTLAGCFLIRSRDSVASGVAAGLIFALGYMAKQTVGLIAPAIMLYSLLQKRRQGVALFLSLGLAGGISFLAMNAHYDGWFRYYTMRVASLHPFEPEKLFQFGPRETLPVFFVAFALAGAWLYRLARALKDKRDPLVFYSLFALALIGTSWQIRMHQGAYVNVLMPACAALAILFAISFEKLREEAGLSKAARVGLLAAALLQMVLLVYNPLTLLPSQEDRQAGQEFTRQLSQMPGNVLVFNHGYLARRVGKTSYAHPINIGDVLADKEQLRPGALAEKLQKEFGSKRFDAIIFDLDPAGNFVCKPGDVDPFYAPAEQMHYAQSLRAFRPLSGVACRPEVVFRPVQ